MQSVASGDLISPRPNRAFEGDLWSDLSGRCRERARRRSLAVDTALGFIFDHWIFGTVAATVLGVVIGFAFSRFVPRWKALLSLLLAVSATILLAYRDGAQFAHIPEEEIGDVLTFLLGFYTFIVLMGCSLGQRMRDWFGLGEPRSERDPVEDMVIGIDVSAHTPEAAGMPWVVNRWKVMSEEKKRAWVETHMAAICRDFDEAVKGKGLTDESYIAMMARIDSEAGKPAASPRRDAPPRRALHRGFDRRKPRVR